jgi:hypothetical protein
MAHVKTCATIYLVDINFTINKALSMKIITTICAVLILLLALPSCSTDDEKTSPRTQ